MRKDALTSGLIDRKGIHMVSLVMMKESNEDFFSGKQISSYDTVN